VSKKPRAVPTPAAVGHDYTQEELRKYDALQADYADWRSRHGAALAAQNRKRLAALEREGARLAERLHALKKEYGREDPPPGRRIEPEYTADEQAEFTAWIRDRHAWDKRWEAAWRAADAAAIAAARAEYARLSEQRLALRHRYGNWGLDEYDPEPADPICALRHACLAALDEVSDLELHRPAQQVRWDLTLAELHRAVDVVTCSGERTPIPRATYPARPGAASIRRAAHALLRFCGRFNSATVKRIPPHQRTRPMTLKEAARLMGYTDRHGEKNGAAMLSDTIRKKAIAAERYNRQRYVFDRNDFPKKVHPQIVPEAARNSPRTGGNSP
jgi:site-specific DNA-cytosine methylase